VNGHSATAAIRAEGIGVVPSKSQPHQAGDWQGTVEAAQFIGDAMEYRVRVKDNIFRVKCDRGQKFEIHDTVDLELRSSACTVIRE
jgi:ABC-type Fe3+/spermidine/putrescine transport system ATPase subunit